MNYTLAMEVANNINQLFHKEAGTKLTHFLGAFYEFEEYSIWDIVQNYIYKAVEDLSRWLD